MKHACFSPPVPCSPRFFFTDDFVYSPRIPIPAPVTPSSSPVATLRPYATAPFLRTPTGPASSPDPFFLLATHPPCNRPRVPILPHPRHHPRLLPRPLLPPCQSRRLVHGLGNVSTDARGGRAEVAAAEVMDVTMLGGLLNSDCGHGASPHPDVSHGPDGGGGSTPMPRHRRQPQ